MGWWATADGTGLIGDRPADILGSVLLDSFGDRFDVDLLAGFLVAVGGAVLRNPAELVASPIEPGTRLVAELAGREPLAVPLLVPTVTTGLDEAVLDAVEAVAFQYRQLARERPPTLNEIAETIAFVARGHVVDDAGDPVEIQRIVARPPGASSPDLPFAWAAMAGLLAAGGHPSEIGQLAVAGALADRDWRARLAAVLAVGRLRLAALAAAAASAQVPCVSVGLREDDRRALLAMREVAASRAAGTTLDRPMHPDPDVASRRSALLRDIEAAIDAITMPNPDSPAYVLRALIDPGSVRAEGRPPPAWNAWLP